MKFTVNTKPVVDGLELGIISSNITKFYQKSCIVELTIENGQLRINTEASSIKSELIFKGNVDDFEGVNHLFVDSMLFKNLMKSIDTDTVEFEFREDGLVIKAGKSKFNLPQVVSESDMELIRPQQVSETTQAFGVDKAGWSFIKDQQMYAIAMSFVHPIYTNVWMSDSGDVIVGDFDNSIFTHSSKAQLSSTCLLTDTIINLLTTVPEDSQIIQVGKSYEIRVETDPYSYVCEFMPKYETDEGVGEYSSEAILGLFGHETGIELNTDKILKYISQAELFMSTNDDTIDLVVQQDQFILKNENVNCKVPVSNPFGDFEITFKINFLKDVISHMDSSTVKLSPLMQGDEVGGIIIWTDNMEAVLAGVD